MSRVIDTYTQLVPTQLGNIVIERQIAYEIDVEDQAGGNAASQGKHVQMLNVGDALKANQKWPSYVPGTTFGTEE